MIVLPVEDLRGAEPPDFEVVGQRFPDRDRFDITRSDDRHPAFGVPERELNPLKTNAFSRRTSSPTTLETSKRVSLQP